MVDDNQKKRKDTWFDRLRDTLEGFGVDLENLADEAADVKGVKMVVMTPHLKRSVDEMGKAARDHTVMVRVDEETSHTLDQWVQSGAVKSRSEAAALFIREGLKVRASELAQLRAALDEVEQAKARLRDQAHKVFGGEDDANQA